MHRLMFHCEIAHRNFSSLIVGTYYIDIFLFKKCKSGQRQRIPFFAVAKIRIPLIKDFRKCNDITARQVNRDGIFDNNMKIDAPALLSIFLATD